MCFHALAELLPTGPFGKLVAGSLRTGSFMDTTRTIAEVDAAALAHRDPLAGEPGAHLLGTGMGSTLGGIAVGAATRSVAGPVGTAIGAVVGANMRRVGAKAIAEPIDPVVEVASRREHIHGRPYVDSECDYEDCGVESHGRHAGLDFDEAEADLARDWRPARDARNRIAFATEPAVSADSTSGDR